jgi:hypothetical protein
MEYMMHCVIFVNVVPDDDGMDNPKKSETLKCCNKFCKMVVFPTPPFP